MAEYKLGSIRTEYTWTNTTRLQRLELALIATLARRLLALIGCVRANVKDTLRLQCALQFPCVRRQG